MGYRIALFVSTYNKILIILLLFIGPKSTLLDGLWCDYFLPQDSTKYGIRYSVLSTGN